MSEYIDRMLIINYLKSRRGNFIDDVGKGYDAGIASALRVIETAPDSGAILVVRCGNCIHATDKEYCVCYCEIHKGYLFADDYCSYGEMRDGGDIS